MIAKKCSTLWVEQFFCPTVLQTSCSKNMYSSSKYTAEKELSGARKGAHIPYTNVMQKPSIVDSIVVVRR